MRQEDPTQPADTDPSQPWSPDVPFPARLVYWGQLVRAARGQRGWNQSEVVRRVNARLRPSSVKLARSSLGDFEQGSPAGTNLRLSVLDALFAVLDLDLALLPLNPRSTLGQHMLYLAGCSEAYVQSIHAFVSMAGAQGGVVRDRGHPPQAREL